jgi:hypothetical protein
MRRDGARLDKTGRDGTGREARQDKTKVETGQDGTERDRARRDGTRRDGTRKDGTERDGASRDETRSIFTNFNLISSLFSHLTREWSDPACRNLPWFFFVTARVYTTKYTIKILAANTHCKYFLKIAEVTHFFCTRNHLYNPHNSCAETARAWPWVTIEHHFTREFNGKYGWVWIVNTCKFYQSNYQRKNKSVLVRLRWICAVLSLYRCTGSLGCESAMLRVVYRSALALLGVDISPRVWQATILAMFSNF